MPSIQLPPVVGVVPDVEVNYGKDSWGPRTHSAVIMVVGAYEERYPVSEMQTIEREVWRSEREHENEEDAVTEAVEKLAEMMRKLA